MVDIAIPELEAARVAQLLTIGAELAAAYQEPMRQPHLRKQLACDTQIALSLAASFTATDLLQVTLTPTAN